MHQYARMPWEKLFAEGEEPRARRPPALGQTPHSDAR